MEWTTGSGAARIDVAIPDDLVLGLIDAVDLPRGSTSLDPYRDSELHGAQLVALRGTMALAVAARRERVFSEVLQQLHRTQVEPWMTAMIAARERADRMLSLLEELEMLLDIAIRDNTVVRVLGD